MDIIVNMKKNVKLKNIIKATYREYLNEEKITNLSVEAWRVGDIELRPKMGGIWFAETKEGAENFAKSVRDSDEKAKKYSLYIKNPKYYDSFWDGWVDEVMFQYQNDRCKLMNDLIESGYDGMYIDTDTWNDTADEYSVNSKQYVVFNKSQVRYVGE